MRKMFFVISLKDIVRLKVASHEIKTKIVVGARIFIVGKQLKVKEAVFEFHDIKISPLIIFSFFDRRITTMGFKNIKFENQVYI